MLSERENSSAVALASLTLPAWSQDTAEPGKAMVDAQCNTCHPLSARVGTGYTEEGWKTVMQMMKNHGAQIRADQEPAMMSYLVKAYPVKGRPDAVIVPPRPIRSRPSGSGQSMIREACALS